MSDSNLQLLPNALFEHLVAVRRDLHAHPELSFNEHRTGECVADELEALALSLLRPISPFEVASRLQRMLADSLISATLETHFERKSKRSTAATPLLKYTATPPLAPPSSHDLLHPPWTSAELA